MLVFAGMFHLYRYARGTPKSNVEVITVKSHKFSFFPSKGLPDKRTTTAPTPSIGINTETQAKPQITFNQTFKENTKDQQQQQQPQEVPAEIKSSKTESPNIEAKNKK